MALCLVVDADPASSRLSSKIAGSLGMEVYTVNNGVAAASFCQNRIPDIIILELELPKLDGIGFLNQLHKMLGGMNPYVIVCTTQVDKQTLSILKDKNIRGFIVKPYDPKVLATKLKESGRL